MTQFRHVHIEIFHSKLSFLLTAIVCKNKEVASNAAIDCLLSTELVIFFFNFSQGMTQTALIMHEPSPIVQLSYSWTTLLISTEKRSILWDFHSENISQVGQKERKKSVSFIIY